MFNAGNALDVFYPHNNIDEVPGFPRNDQEQVLTAIFEAWAWLEAQGFLIWSDFANGGHGWRRLSRRGQQLALDEFPDFAAARALPRQFLHNAIRDRVWGDFIRGHYDDAVLFAARQVEIRVREAIGAGDDRYGATLMTDAFHEENGILTDRDALIETKSVPRLCGRLQKSFVASRPQHR